MPRKKEYRKIDIDVEPFLSIMAIVLKLISLILVVIVLRIAVNSGKKKVVNLNLWGGHGNQSDIKEPRYLDCFPDKVVIYPGPTTNSWADLQRPDNDVEKMLTAVAANSSNEYVVIMARPESVKFFRAVRKMVANQPIDVGYDAVDANFKVDWNSAEKALAVSDDTVDTKPDVKKPEKPPSATPPH